MRSQVPGGPSSLANWQVSPEMTCAKRRSPAVDHAREAAQAVRARTRCDRAFSRNQFPDQTQSPWAQCYKLWRAHVVVEKNQQLPKQRLHIAAGSASCGEFLAYA